jgi:hypothetical protein
VAPATGLGGQGESTRCGPGQDGEELTVPVTAKPEVAGVEPVVGAAVSPDPSAPDPGELAPGVPDPGEPGADAPVVGVAQPATTRTPITTATRE